MAQGRRFDLIVFDMDGTLVDTKDGIAETIRAVLRERGIDAPSAASIYPLIGLPLVEILKRYLPAGTGSDEIAALATSYRASYRREALSLVRPFPDVRAILADLRESDRRLAIATGRTQAMADDVLKLAGLTEYFDLVLGVDRVARPKPAPDLALAALHHLDIPAARALVVGDTVHDVEMGRGAGAATCAVTYGAQSRSELAPSRPAHTIDRFADLPAVVESSDH